VTVERCAVIAAVADIRLLARAVADAAPAGRPRTFDGFGSLESHDAGFVPEARRESDAMSALASTFAAFDRTPRPERAYAFVDHQDALVANSDGTFAREARYCASFAAWSGGGSVRIGTTLAGATLPVEEALKDLTRVARTRAEASSCAPGLYPVVVAGGNGGTLLHEACGHLLEASLARDPRNPFHAQLGATVASSVVTLVDEGTTLGAFGSTAMDDEGMPTQRTVLVENGRLVSYLVDRMASVSTGWRRTGSGRRQGFRHPVSARMRNTVLVPGTTSPQELLASIEDGIYCARLGLGWGDVQGRFRIAVEEAYRIRAGRLAEPVRVDFLEGRATELLAGIEACASDLEMQVGLCRTAAGAVRVSVGQPHVKISRLMIR
jgi:TldD protein